MEQVHSGIYELGQLWYHVMIDCLVRMCYNIPVSNIFIQGQIILSAPFQLIFPENIFPVKNEYIVYFFLSLNKYTHEWGYISEFTYK